MILIQTDSAISTTTMVIRKIPEKESEPVVVNIDDVENFTWIENLQNIVKNIRNEEEQKIPQSIVITSSEKRDNGSIGFVNCLK